MPQVNPELEALRQEHDASVLKGRANRDERQSVLISEAEQCGLLWHQLPEECRQRICRVCDIASTCSQERSFHGLAAQLGVDDVDAEWCQVQTRAEMKGPTELLLDLVQDRRAPDGLLAAPVLSFLQQQRHVRCLNDVERVVREAVARCRQALLLRRSSNSAAGEMLDTYDSGYSSGLVSSEQIVGRVYGPAEDSPLDAAPTEPPPSSPTRQQDSCCSTEPLKKQPRGPMVLVTYTADGYEAALRVVNQLKLPTSSRPGFRFLLLENQRRWVEPDPYPRVQKWFMQVNYVMPVLSPGYLAATQNRGEWTDPRSRRLAEDARFIYSLMCAEMEKQRHVNWRFRSVVADDMVESVRDHPLYGSPLFRWPYPISCVEELAECLTDALHDP